MKSGIAASATMALLLAAAVPTVPAQQVAAPSPPPSSGRERANYFMDHSVDREYKLRYAASAQDANELLTAMRNMLDPQTKIFLVPTAGIIVVHAPEDTQAQIAKLLAALDQPHARFRLTYTFTEMDGTRKVGVQHFSLVALSGQRSQLKEGSRIPIRTGSNNAMPENMQFTYLDVGMNVDATLNEIEGGAVLKNKVEQTSIAPDSVSPSNPNPLIRQTLLEGTVSLVLGKPVLLGSLDVPATTHHFDVEVVLEPVR